MRPFLLYVAVVLFGTVTNPNNVANEEDSVNIFQRLCNLCSLLLLILKISTEKYREIEKEKYSTQFKFFFSICMK